MGSYTLPPVYLTYLFMCSPHMLSNAAVGPDFFVYMLLGKKSPLLIEPNLCRSVSNASQSICMTLADGHAWENKTLFRPWWRSCWPNAAAIVKPSAPYSSYNYFDKNHSAVKEMLCVVHWYVCINSAFPTRSLTVCVCVCGCVCVCVFSPLICMVAGQLCMTDCVWCLLAVSNAFQGKLGWHTRTFDYSKHTVLPREQWQGCLSLGKNM